MMISFKQGLINPFVFDHSDKLRGRRKLIELSYDLYDGTPNDPVSTAQLHVYQILGSKVTPLTSGVNSEVSGEAANGRTPTPVVSRQETESTANRAPNGNVDGTPRSSAAASPVPESGDTPQPGNQPVQPTSEPTHVQDPIAEKISAAEERDRILPVLPLDLAIVTSISHGCGLDEKKTRDFMGGIMIVGGGAQFPGFHAFLEARLRVSRSAFAKDIMIGTPPRDLDPQVVIWKGGSVFAKLRGTNDSWISQMEHDRLGSRLLPYKCMWAW